MFPSLWALETQSVKRAANLKTTRLSFKSTRGLSEALYESQEWIMYLSPRCLLSSLEDLRRLDEHKILLAKSRRLQIFCQKSSNDTFWQYYWCFIGLFSDFLVIQSHFCTTILGGSIEFDMFQLMRSDKNSIIGKSFKFHDDSNVFWVHSSHPKTVFWVPKYCQHRSFWCLLSS